MLFAYDTMLPLIGYATAAALLVAIVLRAILRQKYPGKGWTGFVTFLSVAAALVAPSVLCFTLGRCVVIVRASGYEVNQLFGAASIAADGGSEVSVSTSTYPPDTRSALVNASATTFLLRRVQYNPGGVGKGPETLLTLSPAGLGHFSEVINDDSIHFGGAPSSLMTTGGVGSALELVAVAAATATPE